MKKVIILANHILGIYSFRRELITSLQEKGYKVYIAAPYHKKKKYFIDKGCIYIETSFDRKGINPFADIKLLFKYFSIINKIKPTAVLTFTIKPNIYGGIICRILKTPYIANITGLGTVVEKKSLLQKITLMLYKVSLQNVNCLFFQNKENQKLFMMKKIALNQHRLIPGSGVNLEYFKILDYPSDERINFLFISRIMKEKGIDLYLEAAEFIKEKYPFTTFNVLGNCEEDYLAKLNKKNREGIIVYHGRQEDVRKYYKDSHCIIHPSYYPEGMSNVLLESAASGRPVITTNRPGCREVVDDEVTGFIVEQKSSTELIDKIENFISLNHNKKRRMGILARKKVEKEFDRKVVVDAYIRELNLIFEESQD